MSGIGFLGFCSFLNLVELFAAGDYARRRIFPTCKTCATKSKTMSQKCSAKTKKMFPPVFGSTLIEIIINKIHVTSARKWTNLSFRNLHISPSSKNCCINLNSSNPENNYTDSIKIKILSPLKLRLAFWVYLTFFRNLILISFVRISYKTVWLKTDLDIKTHWKMKTRRA